MDMGGIVLSLAALGFLGFGGGPDLAEWGKLVSFGQDNILLGQWWSFFFPGLVIALWALGFYLLGDGIRIFWTLSRGTNVRDRKFKN